MGRIQNGIYLNNYVACGILEATSEDEARGKAMRMCEKWLPITKGWHSHFSTIGTMDVLIPETISEIVLPNH